MSSSASTVAPPVAAAAVDVRLSELAGAERDAVAGGKGLDVAQQVPGTRHLDERDGRARPVVVGGVERAERIRLRQLDGIEGATTLHTADVGRTRAGLRRRLAQGRRWRSSERTAMRTRRACLGEDRRRLGRAERIQSEDPLDLRRHGDGYLRGRSVVVPRLPRSQVVAVDRRREGGLDLRHRARHGQREPDRGRRPYRQTLVAERRGDVCDRARRRSETLRELCRRDGNGGSRVSAGRRPHAPLRPGRRDREAGA